MSQRPTPFQNSYPNPNALNDTEYDTRPQYARKLGLKWQNKVDNIQLNQPPSYSQHLYSSQIYRAPSPYFVASPSLTFVGYDSYGRPIYQNI